MYVYQYQKVFISSAPYFTNIWVGRRIFARVVFSIEIFIWSSSVCIPITVWNVCHRYKNVSLQGIEKLRGKKLLVRLLVLTYRWKSLQNPSNKVKLHSYNHQITHYLSNRGHNKVNTFSSIFKFLLNIDAHLLIHEGSKFSLGWRW